MVELLRKGELEHLIIYAYDKNDYSDKEVDKFEVPLNPEEYTHSYTAEYNKHFQAAGTTKEPGHFIRIPPQGYSLKFLLDGSGASGVKYQVHEKIEKFFEVVGYAGDIHRPRYLKIIWGKLELKCILYKADITYKLFRPNGTPIRAEISATFRENRDDPNRVREDRKSSPDLAHIRIVKQGDSLPLMAYKIYGDPFYYLKVANFNNLDNFRQLKPGTRIIFPPIEKSNNAQRTNYTDPRAFRSADI